MKIIRIHPQGFCKGVIYAIKKLNEDLINAKRPIYMYGGLVHNEHVINAYKEKGVVQISDFSNISSGTIIITAHGISNKKREILNNLNVDIIDTTCIEVKKIQNLLFLKEKEGYEIIYYGSKNHPECMAIIEDHDNIHLIECINDIYKLSLKSDKIFFASQTTASYFDVKLIQDLLLKKYPSLTLKEDICLATKLRQNALIDKCNECDMVIIVGDRHSNNTNKLKEIASKYTITYLIESIDEIEKIDFDGINTLGITAGASTPNILVDEIIKKIENKEYISNIKSSDYIKI